VSANAIITPNITNTHRFAKNVRPEQISVEVLRGKGELHNIHLNEDVLADVLELPAWVHIDKAVCTKLAVNIPWTRLKSAPIQLVGDECLERLSMLQIIDEIHVEISIRSSSSEQRPDSKAPASKSGGLSNPFSSAAAYAYVPIHCPTIYYHVQCRSGVHQSHRREHLAIHKHSRSNIHLGRIWWIDYVIPTIR
jgi:hypothetical protein